MALAYNAYPHQDRGYPCMALAYNAYSQVRAVRNLLPRAVLQYQRGPFPDPRELSGRPGMAGGRVQVATTILGQKRERKRKQARGES